MTKSMIVAYDDNRLIGNEGGIPWQGRQRADMKHFRDLTRNTTLIMGRKTYETIGGDGLKGRQNIVITHSPESIKTGASIVTSLNEAYQLAKDPIMIIGGARLYESALNDADIIYATEIHTDAGVGDAYFPVLSGVWIESTREDLPADADNKFSYSFVTYSKQQ